MNELKHNLIQLIEAPDDVTTDDTVCQNQHLCHQQSADHTADTIIQDPSKLVGKTVDHTFIIDEDSDLVHTGARLLNKLYSREKLLISKSIVVLLTNTGHFSCLMII